MLFRSYTQGLAKLYANGGLKIEDASSTLADYLTKFHKLKTKRMIPSPRNDFLRYTSVGDFMSVVDEYPEPEDNKNVSKGTSEVYYEDQDLRILVPKDRESACYYGKGTKWCTAATNNNMYDYYSKQDQLYIILLKKPTYTGEKYQFHFASRQYMDEKDHRINLFKLADRYPQLRQIFAKQADQYNVVELLTTKEEFDKVIKPALRDAEDDMNQYVIKNHEELIKTINDQLMRGAGREEGVRASWGLVGGRGPRIGERVGLVPVHELIGPVHDHGEHGRAAGDEDLLPRHEGVDLDTRDGRAAHAATHEHLEAHLARGVLPELQADVMPADGGPVFRGAADRDLELARQVGELGVQRAPLAQHFGIGARIDEIGRAHV